MSTDTDAGPTPTHTHPSSQQHTSAPPTTTSDVSLSSTTIVALGMGFIGAALLVVGITVLLRVAIVGRAVRRARAQGETTDFRSMWRRYGGVWGLLFAPGQQVDWTPVRVRRRRVGPPPKMWDVDVAKLKPEDEFDLDNDASQVSTAGHCSIL